MHAEVAKRMELKANLARASENHEFPLCYRPIVALEDGTLTGFEALLREHPARGLGPPARFIPLAEGTGLIVPIGKRVLEQVCWWLGSLHDGAVQGDLPSISVNLSARQLQEHDLVDVVRRTLQRSGLVPRRDAGDYREQPHARHRRRPRSARPAQGPGSIAGSTTRNRLLLARLPQPLFRSTSSRSTARSGSGR